MRLDVEAAAAMSAGLDRIRRSADVPDRFPPEVMEAAATAISRRPGPDHRDRTDRRFVTLDPATSVDLDQAFAIELAGDDIVLHYAIADVAWFVRPGDALDTEAFARGVTIYLPDRRATLYPTELSEGAASLLPGVERPAVVFTVRVGVDGTSRLDAVERAIVRSQGKLAYDSVSADDLPAGFAELHRRFQLAEQRRGASRVEFPEQHVERNADGQYSLHFRPRLESEDQNAALSLATNLAVAELLYAAGTGLFRVMADVDQNRVRRLRHSAQAFGLEWPRDVLLDQFVRALPRDDPRVGVPAGRSEGGGWRRLRASCRRSPALALGCRRHLCAGDSPVASTAGPLCDRGRAGGRQRPTGRR